MGKLAIDGDNCILDCSDVSSEHCPGGAELRDGLDHSIMIRSILIVFIEEGLSVLVVPEAGEIAIALVVLIDMQSALNISAQLNGGACDQLTEAAQLLHVEQDELRQVDQLPRAQR